MKILEIIGSVITAALVIAFCLTITVLSPANPVSIAFGRACIAVAAMIVGGAAYLLIVD